MVDWKNPQTVSRLADLADEGLSSKEIAVVLQEELKESVNDRSVRRVANKNDIILSKSNRNGYNPDRRVETEKRADGSLMASKVIPMTDEEAMDEEFVLKAHGFDATKWQVVNLKNGYWEQGSREEGKKRLYSSKITVKPIEKVITEQDIIDKINGKIDPIILKNKKIGDKTLIIPLFDVHFGIETFEHIEDKLEQILQRIRNGYKDITIVIGGDFFHSDFMSKTQTANNTQLDHVENEKALEDGAKFLSYLIEESIVNAEHVSVKGIGGNHDRDKQFMFLWGIQNKYPQATIDITMESRTAFSVNKIGIMVAHGDLAVKRLPMLFATEFPEIWSNSTYRTVMTGHYHTEKVTDIDGVVMRQFGTSKKSDPYEKVNGYTMARKHIQVLEFNNNRLLATYEVE